MANPYALAWIRPRVDVGPAVYEAEEASTGTVRSLGRLPPSGLGVQLPGSPFRFLISTGSRVGISGPYQPGGLRRVEPGGAPEAAPRDTPVRTGLERWIDKPDSVQVVDGERWVLSGTQATGASVRVLVDAALQPLGRVPPPPGPSAKLVASGADLFHVWVASCEGEPDAASARLEAVTLEAL